MNKSKVSGDSKIVMGSPIPKEEEIDIPPRTAAEKVIEEGEIVLTVEQNTPEILKKLEAQKGIEH